MTANEVQVESNKIGGERKTSSPTVSLSLHKTFYMMRGDTENCLHSIRPLAKSTGPCRTALRYVSLSADAQHRDSPVEADCKSHFYIQKIYSPQPTDGPLPLHV